MKEARTNRRWLAGAGVVCLAAGSLAWEALLGPRAAYRPRPLPRELTDLGVACVALGAVQPPVQELSEADLQAIVELLARLIAAYQYGDFDSFLALRAGDIEHSNRARAPQLAELRHFCRQLGVAEPELRGDWVALLGRYWAAYYAQPPVARFLPESTRIELHREGIGSRELGTWEESFEQRLSGWKGALIRNDPCLVHRRSIQCVAADSGPLAWLDLAIDFETPDARCGRLLVRLVRDELAGAWFLHRAATAWTGASPERLLVL